VIAKENFSYKSKGNLKIKTVTLGIPPKIKKESEIIPGI
jgi:hypothetical protein